MYFSPFLYTPIKPVVALGFPRFFLVVEEDEEEDEDENAEDVNSCSSCCSCCSCCLLLD
jgi:hypothetical protein